MKIRSPIYLCFSLALAGTLTIANHNGWGLIDWLAAKTWQHYTPSTQHK